MQYLFNVLTRNNITRNAVAIKNLICKHWNDFKSMIDFNPMIHIHIHPIKGATNGTAFMSGRIEIDLRRADFDSRLETVAHELVHSEQYKQKRLTETARNYERIFDGRTYSLSRNNSNEYLNRPWEIEARRRAAEVISVIKARRASQVLI